MRKVIVVLVAVLAFSFAQAQDSGIKLGIHLGLPVGDADDFTSLAMGGDLAYMFDVSEAFKVGPSVGYLHYSGKKYHGHKRDNLGFIPIAASAKYSIVENIFIGADLGYAVGISPSELDGGFYYLPKVGYQIDLFEVYVGYRGISNKIESESYNISSVSLGFNYNF